MEKEKEYFIHVEYCTNCHSHSWCTHHNQAKYHQTFIKLKNLAHEQFKQQKQKLTIVSNLVPKHFIPIKKQQNKYYDSINKKYVFYPNIGAFDVSINGQNIFSKKKDNNWPSLDNILDVLYQKIKNQKRSNNRLSKIERNITNQNQFQFQSENNRIQQKTLYKEKSNHKNDFSLTTHFKAYHTQGSSTTIGNQYSKNSISFKQKNEPLKSSRLKINVQNIQKLKEALQNKQTAQNYQIISAQKSKQKEILINLSSIQQQNTQQNLLNFNFKKNHYENKSQSKIISQKSLSRKKLQQWESDLNSAENQFTKIQNKVNIRQISKIPDLELEIDQNPNEQLQTNLNSSLREGLSRQKYNKKNIQSFHKNPFSIFQNLQGSRFKQCDFQQDFINWKSHENIAQSKKIKQIETYIQANQQYKNQKLRKIYGNWKFQGTYSEHFNSDNAYKLNYKKAANGIFKIKKNKNIKIYSDKNKKTIDEQRAFELNNDQKIQEDNESSASSPIVRLKQQKYVENKIHKKQTIQMNQQGVNSKQNSQKQFRNTAGRYSKLNQEFQNKRQSKSLIKISQSYGLNKSKYHKEQYKFQPANRYNKEKKYNAIEMGQKKLNGNKNSNYNYHKHLFKQVKSFHFQNKKYQQQSNQKKNKKYQQQKNQKQKLRMANIQNSIPNYISHNKQNALKKSPQKKSKRILSHIKNQDFNKQIPQKKDFVELKSSKQKNHKEQNKLNQKNQISKAWQSHNKIKKSQVIEKKIIIQKNLNVISSQPNQQNQKLFQNNQIKYIQNKSSRIKLSTNQVNVLLQNKSSRIKSSKNQVNILMQNVSKRQFIQNELNQQQMNQSKIFGFQNKICTNSNIIQKKQDGVKSVFLDNNENIQVNIPKTDSSLQIFKQKKQQELNNAIQDYQTKNQSNNQSSQQNNIEKINVNNLFQNDFDLNQKNGINYLNTNELITFPKIQNKNNKGENNLKKNHTHKKSKFSEFDENLKEQKPYDIKLNNEDEDQIRFAYNQNNQSKQLQQEKIMQNQYRIDLKQTNQKSERQSFFRSQSYCESLVDKQQKQPCKCTLRLEQSLRKKCQSQQKSIIKHRENEKRYIETKRRRQLLQKQRQQYLRKREQQKNNKTSKNNSFQQNSRVKSYTSNILNQKKNKENSSNQINKSRAKIENKRNRKQMKELRSHKQQHKQHSKTIDFQKQKKTQKNQIQQGWHNIFQEHNNTQSVLNKSHLQDQINFLKSQKFQNNVKVKKQKNKKKYYQTTAIQTINVNEVSVQTQWIDNKFNQNQILHEDNCYRNVYDNQSNQSDLTKINEKPKSRKGQKQQKIKIQCQKSLNQNNIKITPQVGVKIQSNTIFQQEKQPQYFYKTSQKLYTRTPAQITKQLYGQQISKQKQKYQAMLKNNQIFGVQKFEERRKDEQYPINKSVTQIYDFDLKLFDRKINVNGYKSNCQNNINFMKATLMLANKNQLLIVRLFQDYKQNIIQKKKENINILNRLYGVWVCVNYRWKIIVVDDTIPVMLSQKTKKYEPLFCQPLNQCIWPLILEKAISVACGGYANYLKMSCGQIFQLLTGSNYIDFKINQDLDKNKQFLKYISQNQRKNYIIHCQKNAKNIKQHEDNISQIKIFSIISKKIVNGQQILFKMQETSSQVQNQQRTQMQPYYIKYQKFCQSFKSCEILHLRQHHNYCQVQLSNKTDQNNNNCNKFFFVIQLSFQEEAFGCITVSNKYRGNLKSYLYRQQNGDTQLLKLVGEASKNNKKQLFFDCCFQPCKYMLFIQTQHPDSILSYLGQGKPKIIIKQQILENGLKNNITQYLPVSIQYNNKNNSLEFTKPGQILGFSRLSKFDASDHSNNMNAAKGFQQLRQKFISLIIQGRHNNP